MNTGYDLTVARTKKLEQSGHQKEDHILSQTAIVSDTNSYIPSISSHFQDTPMGSKVSQEPLSANIPSFSPAQSFVASTFASGVGGSITSLSDFMTHQIPPNYSSSYSQHNFPTSISQGQYSYHRSSAVPNMALFQVKLML